MGSPHKRLMGSCKLVVIIVHQSSCIVRCCCSLSLVSELSTPHHRDEDFGARDRTTTETWSHRQAHFATRPRPIYKGCHFRVMILRPTGKPACLDPFNIGRLLSAGLHGLNGKCFPVACRRPPSPMPRLSVSPLGAAKYEAIASQGHGRRTAAAEPLPRGMASPSILRALVRLGF